MPKIVQRIPPLNIPKKPTLQRYGLTAAEWLAILLAQGNVCAICKKFPKTGKWVIDHEHVPNFKKLSPTSRKLYVRGVICHWCNSHVVGRFVTLEKAINVVAYFKSYNRRRPKELHKPLKKLRKKLVRKK